MSSPKSAPSVNESLLKTIVIFVITIGALGLLVYRPWNYLIPNTDSGNVDQQEPSRKSTLRDDQN